MTHSASHLSGAGVGGDYMSNDSNCALVDGDRTVSSVVRPLHPQKESVPMIETGKDDPMEDSSPSSPDDVDRNMTLASVGFSQEIRRQQPEGHDQTRHFHQRRNVMGLTYEHSNKFHRSGSQMDVSGTASGQSVERRPTRENVLRRLSEALMRRSLTMIDLSQRGLVASDARLVKLALLQNSSLSVLRLAYNNLGDEGITTLASGIATHKALETLDLGFNNVGDFGAVALCRSLMAIRGTLRTLYLSGNFIGERGALELAGLLRSGTGLLRLHLTGNSIGNRGAEALCEAVAGLERDLGRPPGSDDNGGVFPAANQSSGLLVPSSEFPQQQLRQLQPKKGQKVEGHGIRELFLDGTGIGISGCRAVASMLGRTSSIRVLSLANCDIGDAGLFMLAESIGKVRETREINRGLDVAAMLPPTDEDTTPQERNLFPMEVLHLSFNSLTSAGVEQLMTALWQTRNLRELRLDNNAIGDRGAQVVSALLSSSKSLVKLDVGFNSLSSNGLRAVMKSVAASPSLASLSVSGNSIDLDAAKTVAYALAYNKSLTCLFLDHCNIGHEGQRHVTAGVVSNSATKLHTITGFRIGGVAVSLGFPSALEMWSNEQVLKFIHLMWERMRQDDGEVNRPSPADPSVDTREEQAKVRTGSGPLHPATVVTVARSAFESLGERQDEALAQRPRKPLEPSFQSPLCEDAVMIESSESENDGMTILSGSLPGPMDVAIAQNGFRQINGQPFAPYAASGFPQPTAIAASSQKAQLSRTNQSTQKRLVVEWLCRNIHHLNEMAKVPFSSAELWRLHQHFSSSLVMESGCDDSTHGWAFSTEGPNQVSLDNVDNVDDWLDSDIGSVQSMGNGIVSSPTAMSAAAHTAVSDAGVQVPASEPAIANAPYGGNFPMLKRKVSYRHLGEAHGAGSSEKRSSSSHNMSRSSISQMIDEVSGQSLQPRSKRARRNRTRISFLPRVKAKLSSLLEVDHFKALVLMRQLHWIERSLLRGAVYPLDPSCTCSYLCGSLATSAETILIDMM